MSKFSRWLDDVQDMQDVEAGDADDDDDDDLAFLPAWARGAAQSAAAARRFEIAPRRALAAADKALRESNVRC